MSADWGPLDRLVAQADALAGAWGARARASTTIGQERAILRLFGVSGLDAAGRPLAGRDRRSLAGRRPARARHRDRPAVRDGAARVRPRAAAARHGHRVRARSTWPSRASSCASATAGRSPRPRRRAWRPSPIERIDAQRTVRRETIGDARRGDPAVARGDPPRAATSTAALDEATSLIGGRDRPDPDRGADRARAGRPADRRRCRGAGVAPRRPARPVARSRAGRTGADRQPAGPDPAPRQRRPSRRQASRLRPAGDRRAGARGARGRRRRRLRADRPHRLGCDGRDRRRRRRAGSRAGRPRLRAPPGAAAPGRPSWSGPGRWSSRRTCRRACRPTRPPAPGGRSRSSCSGSALARGDGLRADQIIVGALPPWLTDEPVAGGPGDRRGRGPARALPGHPLGFVEPPTGTDRSILWPYVQAAAAVHAGDVALVLRAADFRPDDALAAARAARAASLGLGRRRRRDRAGSPDRGRPRPRPRHDPGRAVDPRAPGRPRLADGRRRSARRAARPVGDP